MKKICFDYTMLTSTEIFRQIIHIVYGTCVILLLFFFPEYGSYILFSILIVSIFFSWYEKHWHVPVLKETLDILERERHRKKFPGKGFVFFNAGAYISVIFFNHTIALASITILTIGDALNILFGAKFGKKNHAINETKKIEGTIVGAFAAFFCANIFVSPLLAFVGSIAGMIVEVPRLVIGKWEIDDNLLVPVVAGMTMTIAS